MDDADGISFNEKVQHTVKNIILSGFFWYCVLCIEVSLNGTCVFIECLNFSTDRCLNQFHD